MNNVYRQKVELLLRILPFVTDEDCFAIHGGTAINLFVKNLYRLSVDIDVTYIPIEGRNTSLEHINEALLRIAERVRHRFPNVRVIPRLDICKITCESHGCQVKDAEPPEVEDFEPEQADGRSEQTQKNIRDGLEVSRTAGAVPDRSKL